MKTEFIKASTLLIPGAFRLLLFTPVLILVAGILGLIARLLWVAATFGFNLLP